jgi:hypothetical protein
MLQPRRNENLDFPAFKLGRYRVEGGSERSVDQIRFRLRVFGMYTGGHARVTAVFRDDACRAYRTHLHNGTKWHAKESRWNEPRKFPANGYDIVFHPTPFRLEMMDLICGYPFR